MKQRTTGCWSKTTLLYKAFYFVFYAGYISFLLYVPVYFKYLGLSAIYVGLLNGIRPLMQTVGAPLWGVIGDKFRIRKMIFVLAFVVMTTKTMLFLLFRPESTLCVVTHYNSTNGIVKNETFIVRHDIIKHSKRDKYQMPWTNKNNDRNVEMQEPHGFDRIGSLDSLNVVDSTFGRNEHGPKRSEREALVSDERVLVKKDDRSHTVEYKLIHDEGETTHIFFSILLLVICGDAFDAAVFTLADTSCLDVLGSENYGYYRLWGSAGWGVVTPIVGFVITHLTQDYCGTLVGSYSIIFYFYLGFMYLGLLFGSHFEFSYDRDDHVSRTVKSALLNFHYGVFLFVTFYAGVCYGFLLYFVNWFIDSLGGTAIIMGTATACKSITDVLAFFLAGKIINTLGHLNTVTISLMAYIGAFVSYSYITSPWYAIPIEVLHAGAYALVWSSSVSYLNKAAPAGSSATVQGILQGVYWGLGTGGGTIVGGYVVHVFGLRSTFRAFAVVTGVVLVVFLTTQFVSKYSDFPEENKEELEYTETKVEEDENENSEKATEIKAKSQNVDGDVEIFTDNSCQTCQQENVEAEGPSRDLDNQHQAKKYEDTTKLLDHY